jgi:hypothetical protein
MVPRRAARGKTASEKRVSDLTCEIMFHGLTAFGIKADMLHAKKAAGFFPRRGARAYFTITVSRRKV